MLCGIREDSVAATKVEEEKGLASAGCRVPADVPARNRVSGFVR